MTRSALRKIVILLTAAIAVSYLVYRGVYTLNLTTTYASIASIVLYVGELYGVINMLLYFVQVWEVYEPPHIVPKPGQTVDVFVPTYNEDPDMLRTTLLACVAMDYPHKTFLCDDGGTEARCNDPVKGPPSLERQAKLMQICQEVGAIYLTRPKNEHAKAGNLNHAFELTDGEFLIIFDADHVPEPHFISRLLGYFEDPKLAFVQTPHAFYNFDSFQARLSRRGKRYWEEGQLFYHVIQPGRNRWGCPIFAGSAALFRRAALKEVGYIATETITEDMHTGMRMHARGWTSMGISERMVAGQAAQDVTTFHSQRERWGEGNISVIFHDNPMTMRGLTIGQRLCYMATVLNWGGGVFKLFIYLTPLMMLFTGVPPVKEFTWGLAAFMGLYMAGCILGTKYAGNGYGSFWYSELFTMASFWTQIRGAWKALFMRKFSVFVVTLKRGRQSKSIWPYIRPQVYLILFSLLAVTWAWSRLFLGVSDDPFKPMLATFWACFHMWLAYLIVRRAFWPADQRYTTRHAVSLPVTYRPLGETGPKRLGMTTDLNDLGCTLVGYKPMAVGDKLRLSVHSPDGEIEVTGELRNVRELASPSGDPYFADAGFRFGVKFEERSTEAIDALNLTCLHYAVPRAYRNYAEGHRPLWMSIPAWLYKQVHRKRRAERREYRLPLYLFPVGRPEEARYAVTEDVSRSSAAMLLPVAFDGGTEIRYSMATPLGEVSGVGIVLRSIPRVIASRTFHLVVIEFDRFDAEGRDAVADLFRPEIRRDRGRMLEPRKDKLPVPMNRPLAVGVLLAFILVGLELGAFRFAYQDDFYLNYVAKLDRPLTSEESENVDRIYRRTMAKDWPGTDRLVLLTKALDKMDRPTELAEVTRRLAPRAPNNLELQLALAYAHDQREDFAQADAEFRKALDAIDAGRLPESRREAALSGAARSAARSGNVDLAAGYYRDLAERFPEKPAYRNEHAGALLGARRFPEALAILRAGDLDTEGRILLVHTLTASGDLGAAEREARSLAAARPEDPAALGLLADVVNARGDHSQAKAMYEKLLNSGGDDVRIGLQLANASLWAKNYDDALTRYRNILARQPDPAALFRAHPQARRSYVNASASATTLDQRDLPAALALFEAARVEENSDAVYLARLGWVLQRHNENDRGATLVDRALTLSPDDAGLRRQLAGVLVAAGRAEEALRLLQESNPGPEGRLLLADAYLAVKDFDAAERETRTALAEQPSDKDARLRLANILSWKGNNAAALPLFTELSREYPNDGDLAMRLADVTLWTGDHATALMRFHALLAADFDRPWLWYGFIDAAASASTITPEQAALVRSVAERTTADDHKSPRVAAEFRKRGRPLNERPFLTRLGWVLVDKLKHDERVTAILDKAVATKTPDPGEKRELAGVLAAAKRYDEAVAEFDGLELQLVDRLQLARIHAAAGRFPQAIAQCREALALQPLHRDARLTLADVLSWDGQFAESLRIFDALVDAEPTAAEPARRRAEVLLWSGDVPRALVQFEQQLGVKPDDERLWSGFLESARRSETLTPTQAVLADRGVARTEGSESADCDRRTNAAGVARQHLKDLPRAKTLLAKAVAVRPKDAGVLGRLAWEAHRLGDATTVALVLGEAISLVPKDPKAKAELAGVLTAVGRFDDALILYAALAEQQPGADVQERIALVTFWSGNSAKALDLFEKLLTADITRSRLHRPYADSAAGVAKPTPSQVALARRLAEQPTPEGTLDEQATYFARLAWVLQRATDSPATVKSLLDRALALKPTTPAVRLELAGVLTAAGRFDDSLPWLRELATAEPNNLDYQQRLAEALLGAGKFDDAVTLLTKQLEADFTRVRFHGPFVDAMAGDVKHKPTNGELALLVRLGERPPPEGVEPVAYLTRLAATLQRGGKLDLADPVLKKAIALAPKDPKSRLELTNLMTAAGHFAEARDWLEKLAAENPNDAALQGRLAQVLLWSGDRPDALTRFTKLLEADIERPQWWSDFIDAASPLDKGGLTPAQVALAEKIAARPVPMGVDQSVYRSRLGWILHREGRVEVAGPLLEQAAADPPRDPKSRRELGGVLAAAGKTEQAIKLFDGIELTADDRLQLVALHAAARQFKLAISQAEIVVRDQPNNLLAKRRLAEVTLWGGDYPRSLDLYVDLLTEKFDQPEAWTGFVEAATKAGRISDAAAKLAVRIADEPATLASKDALLLARVGLVLHRDAEGRESFARVAVAGLGGNAVSVATVAVALRTSQVKAKALMERAVANRPREATPLARLAWTLHQAGYEAEAAVALDEGIALKPPAPGVRRELGDVLVATRRLREALDWFEDLAKTNPGDVELRSRLAEVTVWAGEYAMGLQRLEDLLAADLEQPQLWLSYIDASSGVMEMSPTQLAMLRRIIERPMPESWEPLVRGRFLSRSAWAFLREGERVKSAEWTPLARPLLDSAVNLRLADSSFRRELAGVLAAARRYKEALAMLTELERESPDEELNRRIASLLLADNQPDAAMDRLARFGIGRADVRRDFVVAAARLDRLDDVQLETLRRIAGQATADVPDPAAHRARIGQAFLKTGTARSSPDLVARGQAQLDLAVAALSTSPAERREVAGLLAAAGRPAQALEAIRGIDLTDVAGRSLLVDLHAANNDMPAAEREARALAAAVPEDWDARRKLADVLGWNKKYAEAIEKYRDLARERPTDGDIPLRLAQMALWSRDFDSALGQFQKLVDAGDRRPEVRDGFIDAAGQAKSLDVAVHRKSAFAVADQIPATTAPPELLGRAAWMLTRLKESGRASVLLGRMLAADPSSREVRRRLAEALTEAGQTEEAEKHFRHLLRTRPNQ